MHFPVSDSTETVRTLRSAFSSYVLHFLWLARVVVTSLGVVSPQFTARVAKPRHVSPLMKLLRTILRRINLYFGDGHLMHCDVATCVWEARTIFQKKMGDCVFIGLLTVALVTVMLEICFPFSTATFGVSLRQSVMFIFCHSPCSSHRREMLSVKEQIDTLVRATRKMAVTPILSWQRVLQEIKVEALPWLWRLLKVRLRERLIVSKALWCMKMSNARQVKNILFFEAVSKQSQSNQGICLEIQRYLCTAYDYVEKADLRNQNPNRKLDITRHFSETIELTFGKKMPYIICILKLF